MQTTLSCIPCLIKQGIKITNFLNINDLKSEEMIREILGSLKDEDYQNTPPYLAKKVYSIICKFTQTDDPYKEIKKYYNREIL
ncbi:MAG: ARMT1-like domain-containing protein, partial [Psychrilyobacter sp.]|uniref:ARMT1-like domain-containing protein n=1 Tax=Psychrilyobacter sp. TaxID=2586924 RepID=UPI003C7141AE